MKENLCYVSAIQKDKIIIKNNNKCKNKILKKLGACRKFYFSKIWYLSYSSEKELSINLQNLRNEGIMFSGGNKGWEPSDIYCYLRDKGKVFGKIYRLEWLNQDEFIKKEV
ncbi:MAG: hypothetical protein LEGION0398_MBIBDBAK_00199 [Legionellaceae bacterium]